jgi:hypothetical protein
MLRIIKKYSPSELKYDKRITAQTEKQEYIYRISDVHFEIDMSLLGCNSKLLWNEIFLQIIDIISVKQEKIGIIVCKNFHLIHTELLEIFYSYIQQYNSINSHIRVKFFILTEHLSFIPTNIVNSCHILRIKRPEKNHYIKYLKSIKNVEIDDKTIKLATEIDMDSILNIKELHSFPYISNSNNTHVTNNIYIEIKNPIPFDEDWDISKIDEKTKTSLLFSKIMYTGLLDEILKNEINNGNFMYLNHLLRGGKASDSSTTPENTPQPENRPLQHPIQENTRRSIQRFPRIDTGARDINGDPIKPAPTPGETAFKQWIRSF